MFLFEQRQFAYLDTLHTGQFALRGFPLLTIVVPVFDEEAVLATFAARTRPVLDDLQIPYEVIFVDDGSTDGTPSILVDIARGWEQVRVITLRRNVGHQAALTAGLDYSQGKAVISMDVDLQDPPEVIPAMVEVWRRGGVDVVYAIRADRSKDSHFKRSSARLYYRMMRRVAGDDVPSDAGDFRLMSRAVVQALSHLPERNRVYRLLVPWLGFPSATITYTRDPRAGGHSKYSISKMTRLAFDSVTSFSAQPLRIATWSGVLGSAICLVAVVTAVIAQLAGHTVPGWASVFVAVLFLGAIQLLCLGLLGEYVGRLYAEAQRRPLYHIASDSADWSSDASAPPADGPRPEPKSTP
jgi:dolichol-phosphate mannosyltransferase